MSMLAFSIHSYEKAKLQIDIIYSILTFLSIKQGILFLKVNNENITYQFMIFPSILKETATGFIVYLLSITVDNETNPSVLIGLISCRIVYSVGHT